MRRLSKAYDGCRVLVTGHTGFKGSWLSHWLLTMRAEVWGYSLPPPTDPSLFEQLRLSGRMHHTVGDVRDLEALKAVVRSVKPQFVFHLAAQPLVRFSYKEPVETYATNVMGSVNLLEALRSLDSPCAAVFVTTDKCYENLEVARAYEEGDHLGGYDPYSSSKAACEIAVSGYRRSYFNPARLRDGGVPPVAIASARAGNVIGGGDWATDRILPDSIRALSRGAPIRVRNSRATRPWQHVLEPLGGYLVLGAALGEGLQAGTDSAGNTLESLCSAFNFGPAPESTRDVRSLVEETLRHWPGKWEDATDPKAPHEASLLSLSIAKAERVLGWKPRWSFAEAVAHTVSWYREQLQTPTERTAQALTSSQIEDYVASRA